MFSINQVVNALGKMDCVSRSSLIGSYIAGKVSPKDIDILLTLNIDEAELERSKRKLKGSITRVLKKHPTPSLFDIFLVTLDGSNWRLRPWIDIDSGKLSWDWE